LTEPSTDPELAEEQAYVAGAYARLEAMRAAAERVRAAYADVRAGGTHQARLERDIAWDVTQRRLSDLDIGESPLLFGRLDMEDASRWYVGRIAVEDDHHTPLVVDWRAPIAEPFYRATAIAPMGVVRRRHLMVTSLQNRVLFFYFYLHFFAFPLNAWRVYALVLRLWVKTLLFHWSQIHT
jgi:hypothetical protein